MFLLLTIFNGGDQIKEDEMGRDYGTNGGKRIVDGVLVKNRNRKEGLKELGVERRATLKWILNGLGNRKLD